ncbi:hypothetical protein DM860_000124 [Cuscuta australis]|uniref:C2H2-type domain-containing protein n=1 Tax=Cuscuta australis TaxID=267555 RepID=A0A328CXN5_9ASTE|nr:hypothetical protein DM860_000124 [Cuscuta australis]
MEEDRVAAVERLVFLANVCAASFLSPPGADASASFACKTCDKKFASFQALGGHRASHKRARLVAGPTPGGERDGGEAGNNSNSNSNKGKQMHCCSICGVEFTMGQALGGHMRRHRAAALLNSSSYNNNGCSGKPAALPVLRRANSGKRVFGVGLDLDLNLTPPDSSDFAFGSNSKTPHTPVLHCFF